MSTNSARQQARTAHLELLSVMGAAKRLCEFHRKSKDCLSETELRTRLFNLENAVRNAEIATGLHATDEG